MKICLLAYVLILLWTTQLWYQQGIQQSLILQEQKGMIPTINDDCSLNWFTVNVIHLNIENSIAWIVALLVTENCGFFHQILGVHESKWWRNSHMLSIWTKYGIKLVTTHNSVKLTSSVHCHHHLWVCTSRIRMFAELYASYVDTEWNGTLRWNSSCSSTSPRILACSWQQVTSSAERGCNTGQQFPQVHLWNNKT